MAAASEKRVLSCFTEGTRAISATCRAAYTAEVIYQYLLVGINRLITMVLTSLGV
jgi:hypothetical protein